MSLFLGNFHVSLFIKANENSVPTYVHSILITRRLERFPTTSELGFHSVGIQCLGGLQNFRGKPVSFELFPESFPKALGFSYFAISV